MIARLTGRVAAAEADALLVDVSGVAFRVYVPAGVLARAGPPGSEIELCTHLHVRDNELALYGADDPVALGLFEQLLGVTGVGPRLAMAVLSVLEPRRVYESILAEDPANLTRVPGVGRKLAQRIILELKAKVEAMPELAGTIGPALPSEPVADADAVAALLALGYSRGEAERALAANQLPRDATTEDRVLAALRQLARL